MMKKIFSLVAIAVIGTSTCMAKNFTKPVNNAKPRMEQKAVLPPATTTVTRLHLATGTFAALARTALSWQSLSQGNSCNDLYIRPSPHPPRRWQWVGRFFCVLGKSLFPLAICL